MCDLGNRTERAQVFRLPQFYFRHEKNKMRNVGKWGGGDRNGRRAGAQVRSMDAAEVLTLYAGSTLRQD
jgi:hypothetical protein